MKTPSLLFVSVTLAFASMAASVGCSQPAVQPFDVGDEDDDDSSDSKSKRKSGDDDDDSSSSSSNKNNDGTNNSAPPAGSSTTPPTNPTPQDPDTQTPPGDEAAAEACFQQCISGDAKAQQIDAQVIACFDQCQDATCDQQCEQEANQLCQQAATSCDLIFQCDSQCFGTADP